LACSLRDDGRGVDARNWHNSERALFAQRDCQEGLATHLSNCALFAMDELDFEGARAAIGRAVRDVPVARIGHAGLHFRALDLRVKQLADDYDCTEPELAELLTLHMRFRTLGHHDEVMETLWNALARKGRAAHANSLLLEYVTRHRRLRGSLSPGLRMLGEQLQLDDTSEGVAQVSAALSNGFSEQRAGVCRSAPPA
jgi:hypothetical protein